MTGQMRVPHKPMSRRVLTFGKHELDVQVASTPEDIRRGLSGIRSLPGNTGMLFVLPSAGPAYFWMRGTHVPLDIALLDANMRVRSIHTMEPATGEARDSGPVKYAVETNAGWFRRNGVRVGDQAVVEVSLISNTDITKLAKKDSKESTLRKALPVAAAAAAPLLLNSRTRALVSLPVLAGLGSVLTQREDATLPFMGAAVGAGLSGRLGALLARKGMLQRAIREDIPGLRTRTARLPLARVIDLARKFPKSPAGSLVLGATALGGAAGAHLGNK